MLYLHTCLCYVASPAFFPLPLLFEIVLSGCKYEDQSTYQKWFIQCFLQCGVSYEQIVNTLGELIDLKPDKKDNNNNEWNELTGFKWNVLVYGTRTK